MGDVAFCTCNEFSRSRVTFATIPCNSDSIKNPKEPGNISDVVKGANELRSDTRSRFRPFKVLLTVVSPWQRVV